MSRIYYCNKKKCFEKAFKKDQVLGQTKIFPVEKDVRTEPYEHYYSNVFGHYEREVASMNGLKCEFCGSVARGFLMSESEYYGYMGRLQSTDGIVMQ